MITIEGTVRLNISTSDEKETLETIKRVGFRYLLSDSVKHGLEGTLGKLDDFSFDLIPDREQKGMY